MSLISSITRGFVDFIENLSIFIIPEENRIKRVLELPLHKIKAVLPKSNLQAKNINVLFNYQNNTVKGLVHAIKYKDNGRARKTVSTLMYDEILYLASDILLFEGSVPIIVPMPMSKKEEREKGFNHCLNLCKEIEKNGGLNFQYDILKKHRETAKQKKLKREERMLNMQDSMVAKNLNNHKVAIIIDDVYTTGSTFREAKRALEQAGFLKVYGIFIAH